jgi:hypothetical protein
MDVNEPVELWIYVYVHKYRSVTVELLCTATVAYLFFESDMQFHHVFIGALLIKFAVWRRL